MYKIGIIMGSDSDLNVMSESAKILDDFNINYELTIVSAHRTPNKLYKYAKDAYNNGINIIIAGAGGAAHLPGMVASISSVPVIGVPIKTKTLNGLDSLYSIVQMPSGVPVATMAINGSANAALLAIQMLGIKDANINKKIIEYKNNLCEIVEKKAEKLENIKYKKYLDNN